MSDLWIIFMYLFPIAAVAAFWVVANVGFYIFCRAFLALDNYIQNRYWRSRVTPTDLEKLDRIFREAV